LFRAKLTPLAFPFLPTTLSFLLAALHFLQTTHHLLLEALHFLQTTLHLLLATPLFLPADLHTSRDLVILHPKMSRMSQCSRLRPWRLKKKKKKKKTLELVEDDEVSTRRHGWPKVNGCHHSLYLF
jgi:hypothetical protein